MILPAAAYSAIGIWALRSSIGRRQFILHQPWLIIVNTGLLLRHFDRCGINLET